ncbi:hypothetical protein BH10CYA1_BH10CYA1_46180 [soil metagenome]
MVMSSTSASTFNTTSEHDLVGDSLLETIQLQTISMPAPSRSLYSGIKYGVQFDTVISKAMAKDPGERFQTASEFLKDISSRAITKSQLARFCSMNPRLRVN